MMRYITLSIMLLSMTASVWAMEPPAKPNREAGATVEQKKEEALKILDQRIASLQASKSCVQAAKTHDELRACRDKAQKEMEKARAEIRARHDSGDLVK